MKRLKTFAAVLAAVCLLLPLSANAAGTDASQPQTVAVWKMAQLPECWDPLSELTVEAQQLLDMTADRLYRVSPDGKLVPSLAADLPQDVTAEYAGSFGIPADARRGYAFAIGLKEEARWEDGRQILAQDLLFTIEKMMEKGTFPLNTANWAAFSQGMHMPGGEVVSLMDAGFSSVSEAEDAGITEFYVDTGHFWGLDSGWMPVSDRSRMQDYAIPTGLDEMFISPAYLYDIYLCDGGLQSHFQSEFVGIATGEGAALTREDVGLSCVNDQQLVLVLEEPAASSSVAVKLSKLILLRQDIYGENYGTSADTYLSSGPYRVTSSGDGGITLEPNPCWQGGWEVFQADTIRCTSGS